ncbi:MAG: RdgB/HAM1 family non-canonical purine NTP pyrophosphatase [Odoribacteraceae bacterium]|jgi:XTP/dITP diphosphohydrolase|nr:RdgB/HAM1 family non-canonical purine NTP pyrophosphatase [Odoribacteraceae bacterium]
MKPLIFATRNIHKEAEIHEILGKRNPFMTLLDINFTDELPEEQKTLAGNALQKARYLRRALGVNCFADDTGLEVDALNGAPGILSARFAGVGCRPEDNTYKLLGVMGGHSNRAARFRCVIALLYNHREYTFTGVVEGELLQAPRGDGGFGYDGIFRPAGHVLTFAEMSPEQKNAISHRGIAARALAEFLKQY